MPLSDPQPLMAAHDRSEFSRGKPALDDWLRKRGISNQERGFTSVVVVHEAMRVVGYYGLAPTSIFPDGLPRAIRAGQPPEPVPCLLLGHLATDRRWAGAGIGTGLLKSAFLRSAAASRLVSGRALLVHAVDDEAAAFWRRRGFMPRRHDPMLLARSIADIAATCERAI